MKDITVEELIGSNEFIPVDVRSPIEHKEASIPGSVNIPLFSDEERREIGILYKKSGEMAARWRAMEVVSPKLPDILGQFRNLAETGATPVVHCWRGGMRSKAVATFLEYSGCESIRLSGGYRAFREYILEEIPMLLPKKAVIIHGMTGTGKTDILHELQAKGYPVLDLEQMANHRGSLFGMIGTGDGYNQKTFDALLFKRLNEMKGAPYFIMEAESKRIGRAVQPDSMLDRKKDAIHLFVHSSIEKRVERIMAEYVIPYQGQGWFREEVLDKIRKIEKRLKNVPLAEELEQAVLGENYPEVIRILLIHYYDPRYTHALGEYEAKFIEIDGDHDSGAASLIEEHLPKAVRAGKAM
ncbi:tRNA 2-selenouridine(34) synthase MnmH [Mesobacillus zeae]|uniref:tRNA 2-selenouridine(34) synthase MnmH n=1 Tax=Mesobacillus zeae TaxID=1917180 RepID=A0A398BDA2_9BACI|nr:tRNA 2-selenouridine(34) synthase MnmH [Mesobacillus zeae]RID85573.1 tRNA 2-selenouridine(34) synthase MnmH [Mesobacillus zeae]